MFGFLQPYLWCNCFDSRAINSASAEEVFGDESKEEQISLLDLTLNLPEEDDQVPLEPISSISAKVSVKQDFGNLKSDDDFIERFLHQSNLDSKLKKEAKQRQLEKHSLPKKRKPFVPSTLTIKEEIYDSNSDEEELSQGLIGQHEINNSI